MESPQETGACKDRIAPITSLPSLPSLGLPPQSGPHVRFKSHYDLSRAVGPPSTLVGQGEGGPNPGQQGCYFQIGMCGSAKRREDYPRRGGDYAGLVLA